MMLVLRACPVATRLGIAAIIAIASVIGSPRLGRAQNLGFMPGDAFFVYALTEDFVNSLSDKTTTLNLCYETPLINLGGYAGFDKMQLGATPPQLIKNLRRVYQDHRKSTRKIVGIDIAKDGTRRETELNPPIAFVYNLEVDWDEQRIGLKYNEDWPNLPAEALSGSGRKLELFGRQLDNRAELYQPLVKTYDAVVEDWKNARRFKPLQVAVPKNIAWGRAHEPLKEHVVARAKDIQIVVCTGGDLEEYFLRNSGVEFYQVTSEGVYTCEWMQGDDGVKLVRKILDQRGDRASGIQDKSPGRYYGFVREGQKNEDVMIPIWPDCRLPSAAQTAKEQKQEIEANR